VKVQSVETLSCLAGSLLVAVVIVGVPACGVWEFRVILHRGRCLSCARLALQRTLPLSSCCPGALAAWAFFYCGGHSFGREGLQLVWSGGERSGKLSEQWSGVLCPREDFPSFPRAPRSISFSSRHHHLFPLAPCIPGCCSVLDFPVLLPVSVCVTSFVTRPALPVSSLPFMSLPLVVAALPAVVRSALQGSRGAALARGCRAWPSCVAPRARLGWRSIPAPPPPAGCLLLCLWFVLVLLSFSLRSVNVFVLFMSPFPCVFLNARFAQSALFCTEGFFLLQYW